MEALKNPQTKRTEDKKGTGKSTGRLPTIEWNKLTKEQQEAHKTDIKRGNDDKTISSMEERDGKYFIMKGFRDDRVELRVPCLFHKGLKQSAEVCIRDERHCYKHSISRKEPWMSGDRPCLKCPVKK